jgi:DegV family protein with EDD domain
MVLSKILYLQKRMFMAYPKIALVTDSTNDLPKEIRENNNVYVVPLFILWEEQQMRDGVDIQPEVFYERLVAQPEVFPRTSQPNPQDFEKVFQQAKEDGAEEIIAITISSAMSGTIVSARQAAERMDIPVHVYDSKSNSMSLGWQVLAAARARDKGLDSQGIIAAADRVRQKMMYMISLNTLEYLHRGGRIGGAAKFIGQILNLKPTITVNHNTGEVEAGIPARTRKRAIEALFQNFFQRIDKTQPMHIAVLHNHALEEAKQLAERVKTNFNPQELIISIVSPILGVHTGPEAIALCGYTD